MITIYLDSDPLQEETLYFQKDSYVLIQIDLKNDDKSLILTKAYPKNILSNDTALANVIL